MSESCVLGVLGDGNNGEFRVIENDVRHSHTGQGKLDEIAVGKHGQDQKKQFAREASEAGDEVKDSSRRGAVV
ncbi:uncharacterized protein PV07_07924 [Cladophialophora immunda]|uniref:Uncharacterized protein n=1 Tax=Cladophialophora immunda TaxID=569365 RepID=A0A0D2CD37_9EURO|nr:uncharacterized protein PV07_07924 [Cladophialophora immunda]KIW28245.1 hypothetical protein PV07_07924 [Cladophialophora immunda]